MEKETVVFEGGDQVGKGDAAKNLCESLCEMGYEVNPVAFPCYGTPFGFAIRSFLKNPEIKGDLDMDSEEFLNVKMGLFALNRLEILNSLLQGDDGIYVFDRSPYSNALTMAYHFASNGVEEVEGVDKLVDIALDMDNYMIGVLGLDNCVIRLFNKGGKWKAEREKEDSHDSADVQEMAVDVYKEMEKRVGEGWVNVHTKDDGEWRSHGDILEDNLRFVVKMLDLEDQKGDGSIKNFDVGEVLRALYGTELESSLVDSFNETLVRNDKNGQYDVGEKVARGVAGSDIDIHWYNEDIKLAVRNVLKYSNKFEMVLNSIYGSDFGTKFINSVCE